MKTPQDYIIEGLWANEYTFQVVDECDCDKPKNIVISFDGTGGEAEWAFQKLNCKDIPLYENSAGLSNVCKMHLIAGGNIGNSGRFFEDQVPFYFSGVGTRGNSISKLLKSIPGFSSASAMEYIGGLAYKELVKIYKEGDKLFIFGFSRGAATARLFVSYLDQVEDKKFDYEVNFLGVYDTVVQSIKYSLSEDIVDLDIYKKDSRLPKIVKKAVHFVAMDENRKNFAPTLFNADERVTEIWVPGNHGDVGGGYYHDGISDTVLECMRMSAEKEGLKCREITEDTCKNEGNTLVDPKSDIDPEAFSRFDKDMKIEPNGLDPDVHDERKGFGLAQALYYLTNWLKGFQNRRIIKVREDKTSGEPILVLDIFEKRVKELQLEKAPGYNAAYDTKKYRPEHLKGIPYKVVNSKDMSISEEIRVIEEQVEW